MPTDTPFEQRLHTLYAVSVPTELDRRIERAMATVPIRRSARVRPRRLVALAVAAIFAITAAGPTLEWFGSWHDPFDRLWEAATPVDQTVTADGYRVTVHRAYADRLGVRLAMSVEDLDGRWSGLEVDAAEATDDRGRTYQAWNWSGSKTPVNDLVATWARFLLPTDARGDATKLRVTVTSLAVRSPEPMPLDLAPERIWTSVGGTWSFEFDMPSITQGHAISPVANASKGGVTISLEELGVVPSGIVVRLAIEGLPEIPADSAEGWKPVANINRNGETLDEWELPPGVVGSDGLVTIEARPVVDDLAGHWTISILNFTSATHGQFGESQGPWVLEFDVPETP